MNAIPSPKPNRLKRTALRLAVPFAAASVLFAAYWFTRPPELVWWTSPQLCTDSWSKEPISKNGPVVHVLIPNGWEAEGPVVSGSSSIGLVQNRFNFSEVDRRPWLLQTVLPPVQNKVQGPILSFDLNWFTVKSNFNKYSGVPISSIVRHDPGGICRVEHYVVSAKRSLTVCVRYSDPDIATAERNVNRICKSLRIE